MKNYAELFSLLDKTVENFVKEVNNQQLRNKATDVWSVKDELCHIVFWHTYYAQNYSALAKGEKPVVFPSAGGSTRNQEGVNSLKGKSKDELIQLLDNAQKSLYESIVIKKVPAMDYTNRKRYTTEDFLIEIARHINGHTKQVVKAKAV